LQMDKKQLLRSVRSKEYNTLDELVTEAARIIPHIAQEQRRYKVSVYPDERTIRYYINEGLVDRPSSSKDKPSRFTYRHLLQILAIKHLQAEYLPLTKIKGMLAGLDEEQMEETIISSKDPYLKIQQFLSPDAECVDMLRNVLPSRVREMPEEKLSDIKSDIPEEWLRVSVTDDIEMNIRAGSIPKGMKKEDFIQRLVARLRIYIENEKNKGG